MRISFHGRFGLLFAFYWMLHISSGLCFLWCHVIQFSSHEPHLSDFVSFFPHFNAITLPQPLAKSRFAINGHTTGSSLNEPALFIALN